MAVQPTGSCCVVAVECTQGCICHLCCYITVAARKAPEAGHVLLVRSLVRAIVQRVHCSDCCTQPGQLGTFKQRMPVRARLSAAVATTYLQLRTGACVLL